MLYAKHFNENALTMKFSLFLFSLWCFALQMYRNQAEVTRTSVSLLNVKFVGVFSTVTVITPNQYSADGCQRGTSHLISPHFASASSKRHR